ncbi:NAD(P)-dependent oxidoreductase [Paraburkholderia caffeinilytica]|uniref:NAD(P)-dependent oxidoreductase n=1 Tax=Paraburkholderia caffeinilytica TaxID=1761016 RepID=UPI003DA0F4EE
MKVALIGAGGTAGSRILKELIRREHCVLALARTPSKVDACYGALVRQLNANDVLAVSEAVRGQDAVISATTFTQTNPRNLIDGITAADVMRYIVVGGAGSLETSPGLREMDDPRFPTSVTPEAEAGCRFLEQLRRSELDWSFLCPSRFFEPGERTGKFRLGKDNLLISETGRSAISMEDYAIALIDELERPKHVRQRFTVGY